MLLLNLVQTQNIQEQSELQELLKERGFDMPQATLSRRLKNLKIAKVGGVYKIIELNVGTLPPVLNMQVSEFGTIVLHTHPGQANALAYVLDQKYVNFSQQNNKQSGILGTIAGDDTVLVIIRGKKDIKEVETILRNEFPYL